MKGLTSSNLLLILSSYVILQNELMIFRDYRGRRGGGGMRKQDAARFNATCIIIIILISNAFIEKDFIIKLTTDSSCTSTIIYMVNT